jgi:hypothetical protein
MKILVLGHAEHGKTTFAQMLAERLGCSHIASSRAALGAIWPALSVATGIQDKEQAYRERGAHRALWKALIRLFNETDRTALTKRILRDYDIYDGMRDLDEYYHSKEFFDFIFFVDAFGRNAPKDMSMAIPFDPRRMVKVDNRGDKRQLAKLADDAKYLMTQFGLNGNE